MHELNAINAVFYTGSVSSFTGEFQWGETPLKVCVHYLFQFEAEYRRFALRRNGPGGFQEFYRLLQTIHHIPGVDMLLGYADIHGDLLPINNDDNFHKAVSSANPLLRIIISKKGETYKLVLTADFTPGSLNHYLELIEQLGIRKVFSLPVLFTCWLSLPAFKQSVVLTLQLFVLSIKHCFFFKKNSN